MGDQLCGVIHRNNKLLPTLEHHQVCFNNVLDGVYHAKRYDIVVPVDIIKIPEFRPGIRS